MALYVGGTGDANKLDDYEEGTWTPNMAGNGSGTYSIRIANYTKTGDTVNLSFYINVSNANYGGGSYFNMYGLPFTSTGYACGSFMMKNHTSNNNRWFVLYISDTNAYVQSYGSEANANWERLGSDHTFQMIGQITYRTAS